MSQVKVKRGQIVIEPFSFENWVAERWARQNKHAKRNKGQAFKRDLIVAGLGIGGESGEVQEHVKKYFRDGKLPGKDLLLELGDVYHYTVRLAQLWGLTMDQIVAANVQKLENRDKGKKNVKS